MSIILDDPQVPETPPVQTNNNEDRKKTPPPQTSKNDGSNENVAVQSQSVRSVDADSVVQPLRQISLQSRAEPFYVPPPTLPGKK